VYDEGIRVLSKNLIADASNILPGFTVTRLGARNELMVNVRGFDVKHFPIFLDSIPIDVPRDGYPDPGRSSAFDFSEIVLSKGFTSVLCGPNTMGGAINMVSKRPAKVFEMNSGGAMARECRMTSPPLRRKVESRGRAPIGGTGRSTRSSV
jgi:iron complex outermembrane recepter protein